MANVVTTDPPVPPHPSSTTGGDARLPRSFYFADGQLQRDLSIRDLAAAYRNPHGTLWVHIDIGSRQQVALLEKVFGFHPLPIEDVLNPLSRPKVDPYDTFLFVTLRAVRFHDATDDPYDLETTNLYFFIGANFLVTAQAGPSPPVDQVAELSLRTADLVARGPARLAHQIMDVAVDAFFPILERVDEFLDSLEERVFASFDEDALRDIFAVKRMVLSLRRYLAPQREIFNVLSNRPSTLLTPDLQLYFRDIYDHMLRINDSMDTYRDLLSSTMESYLSQVSNRLNLVTKGLSVIATLSVPFVVVSGMWGMNFTRIPLAEHPWGFELMLVLQLGIGIGLIALLRWRKWL
ncbi:MAG: magnesium transporter CorA family protein [Gemmatimonadaceae bacterium]|nr:magnesium transporter CorA family protein [Gemmatimonadaceae bacterium]